MSQGSEDTEGEETTQVSESKGGEGGKDAKHLC